MVRKEKKLRQNRPVGSICDEEINLFLMFVAMTFTIKLVFLCCFKFHSLCIQKLSEKQWVSKEHPQFSVLSGFDLSYTVSVSGTFTDERFKFILR